MFTDSLYREVVLDHARRPRNYGNIEDSAEMAASRKNPTCGDRIKIALHLDENRRIDHIHFQGDGCAISQASASMLTETVMGMTAAEARQIAAQMRQMITTDELDPDTLPGDLFALSGVKQFPTRVRCAMLAWHVLEDILDGAEKPKTEE